MSKGNNQRGRYNALNIRLAKYVALVQAVYDTLNQQAANIAMMTGYDGSKEFHFSDFPQVREAVQRLQQDYVQSMHAIIYRGTSDEWKQSNLVQDLLADKILGKYSSKSWGRKHEVYYQTNSDALKAFQQRKDNGMGLSQRIWNMSGNYKEELEYSISTAIQKGTSAVQLSKKLSKYLNDFPSLKKDYKEKYGKAVDCHDCEYRSIRLARSEINMAYRSAEQTRWMQMDFVLGYEIKLSKKHKKDSDICDDLAGQYPKDFVWTGWHPNDLCYVIPILKTEEEFWHDEDTPPTNQTKPVTEFPSGFNEYMEGHLDKISISNQKGTLSYWLRDNEDVKGCALLMNKAKQVGNVVQDIAERIAGEHGAIVTPINYKGFASLYRKVHYADQYGVRTALTEVKDSVRNTIVLDGDLNSVIKDLAKDSHWLRTKVQTADKFCGYSGNIVNLTMDNGVVAEIQVNTPKMIFAKESEKHARAILGDELYDKIAKETGMEGGLGHKLYEQIRVLDKVADAEKKASLEKQMRDYYSHFQPKARKKRSSYDAMKIQADWNTRKLDKFEKDTLKSLETNATLLGIDYYKEFYSQLISKNFNVDEFALKLYSYDSKLEKAQDKFNSELLALEERMKKVYYPKEIQDKVTIVRMKIKTWNWYDRKALEGAQNLMNDFDESLKGKPFSVSFGNNKYKDVGRVTLDTFSLEKDREYAKRIEIIRGTMHDDGDWHGLGEIGDKLIKGADAFKKDTKAELELYDKLKSDAKGLWDAVDHLHEMSIANDFNVIPKRWREQFNRYASFLTSDNITMYGVQKYYHEIEGAYNIYKLSSMSKMWGIDLAKISYNTPWNIVQLYYEERIPMKVLPMKSFFDKFKHYVPVIWNESSKGAYYSFRYDHVSMMRRQFIDGRYSKSDFNKKRVLYHEYGHAIDHERGIEKRDDLRALFDKFKTKVQTDDYRTKLLAKLDFHYNEMIDDAFGDIAKEDATSEKAGLISDIIESMTKDHKAPFGGHGFKYWDDKDFYGREEFIAHMSEVYWQGDDLLKKVWPDLYNALYKMALKTLR